jgi:Rod binding domain-containing protein
MTDTARIAISSAYQLPTQKLAGLEPKLKESDHSKIEKAARDFESILLGQWLEEAQRAFATAPGSDPDEDNDVDPGHGELQSLAIQSLAKGLTKPGGIGISRMIVRQLEAADGRSANSLAFWQRDSGREQQGAARKIISGIPLK